MTDQEKLEIAMLFHEMELKREESMTTREKLAKIISQEVNKEKTK